MPTSALVDTSYLYALADQDDQNHKVAVASLEDSYTRLFPIPVIPEAAYMIGRRLGYRAMRRFVQQAAVPSIQLVPIIHADLHRIDAIMAEYESARFDFVDLSIMALAERLDVQVVFTFDRRDFSIFRPQHCDYLELLP